MFSAHVHSRYPKIPPFPPPFSTKKKRNPNTEYGVYGASEKDQEKSVWAYRVKFTKVYNLTTPFHPHSI